MDPQSLNNKERNEDDEGPYQHLAPLQRHVYEDAAFSDINHSMKRLPFFPSQFFFGKIIAGQRHRKQDEQRDLCRNDDRMKKHLQWRRSTHVIGKDVKERIVEGGEASLSLLAV